MDTQPTAGEVWTLGDPARLHWQNFGTEWVLFDQMTGQTVLIDSLSAAALMALEAGSLTLPELQAQVASDLDLPPAQTWGPDLLDNLAFLHELGLIEQRLHEVA